MNYSFLNDYNESVHPSILSLMEKYNMIQTVGYEEDEFCEMAKSIIKREFDCPDAMVQFFIGGTAANLTMISHILARSYEAVIAVDKSHINCHEGGAIEATGHKICLCHAKDGKITPEAIERIFLLHDDDDHMVIPKMVYISNTTEMGTIYSLDELKKIYAVCKKYGLYLYLDGARLGSALTAKENDIKKEDLAKYTDAFYIGGTKNGALLGEAAVIVNKDLQRHMTRHMKNKGSILAKGKVMGLQFIGLFEKGLFFELAENANKQAEKIIEAAKEKGYGFTATPQSNQIFLNMPADDVASLSRKYKFSDNGYINDDIKSIRLVTSWATTDEQVAELIEDMKKLPNL